MAIINVNLMTGGDTVKYATNGGWNLSVDRNTESFTINGLDFKPIIAIWIQKDSGVDRGKKHGIAVFDQDGNLLFSQYSDRNSSSGAIYPSTSYTEIILADDGFSVSEGTTGYPYSNVWWFALGL